MKKFVLNILTIFVLASTTFACTYNVSMAHTQGQADDVIDDTASNTPNVSPTVTVPVTPGSNLTIPSLPGAAK